MKLFMSTIQAIEPLQPSVRKCLTALNALKPGELVSTIQLGTLAGVPYTSLNTYVRKQIPAAYKHQHGRAMYYGTPATIKKLIKEIERNAKR